jgi:hypothetical protein
MKLSTSIVSHLLMLALAVTTQVVNGKKIFVNCRVIIPYFLLFPPFVLIMRAHVT